MPETFFRVAFSVNGTKTQSIVKKAETPIKAAQAVREMYKGLSVRIMKTKVVRDLENVAE